MDIANGHVRIGKEPAQLTIVNYEVMKGVLLRTPGSGDPEPNTAPIWIGGPNSRADSSLKGGMPLTPGESMFVPIDDITKLWAVSTEDGQDLAWLAL